jgi:pimeloyl-ACP methyl ester carboxylesterase
MLLAGAGAIYQIVGAWSDARNFPQQGRSVQAGQVKLNIDCSGSERPTVVLDSGLGGLGAPALGWIKVQPEVAKFARVCSYDRAGYGWSEPGPEPRTSLQLARELKALLDAAGEKGSYVLVGHSFGGFNVRMFTAQYPKDVAGVVLVDASHEDQEERLNAVLPAAVRAQEKENERAVMTLAPYLIHLGIARLEERLLDPPSYLSRDLRQELNYLAWQGKSLNAVASELKVFPESAAQVRSAGNLGDRPLIVLTAAVPQKDLLLTQRQQFERQDIWVQVLQAELMRLSTRGKHYLVPDSDHLLPFERPDVVANAIHEVWLLSR